MFKRRKTGTRKSFKRRKVTKPVKAYVKRAIVSQEEKKFASYSAVMSPVLATPILYLQNGLSTGPERFNRVGNSVRMRTLQAYFNLYTATANVAQHIRILLVMDRMSMGVAPTAAQVFSNPLTSFNSPLNPNLVPSRFRIMYDRKFALNIGGGATDVPQVKQVRIKKTWKNGQKIVYNDLTVGNITAINKFALYWIVCNVNAVAANLDFTSTLYFTDA